MEYFVRSFTTQRMFKPEVNNTSDNFIVLTSDNWNDFGYETCFSIDLFQQNEFKEIGNIRILHVDKEKTRYVIPKEFSSLSKEYVSLGMDQEFYISLIDVLGKEEALSVLNDLNDIAISGLENNPNFDIDSEGIQQSFFRSSDGRYLYREVSNTYFENQQSSDWDYKFTFEFEVDEDEYTPIDIDFLKYDKLPNRLFALIGKNGVGKTRFLNELSKALYDSSNPDNKSRFYSNEIPAYHKIIAISFSVFDHFFKGEYEERNRNVETKQANYTYIGLHKIDNTVYTSEELVDINISTFKQLISKNRNERFVELLNMSNILSKEFKNKDIDDAFFKENYSSGQKNFYFNAM
ncbi:hypothetical protein [Paenilisteria weihenstephanensis]|uniref:hypothetical protein n=1 Tax=Listeria weihenstephanensis TaxID=1006155 RepID=UPI0004BC1B6C|nr:hypothetical protein [Listeria weihenstephanensis]